MLNREPDRPGPGLDDERVSIVSNEDAPGRGELYELAQGGYDASGIGCLGELARDGPHVVGVALAGEGGEVASKRRRFA